MKKNNSISIEQELYTSLLMLKMGVESNKVYPEDIQNANAAMKRYCAIQYKKEWGHELKDISL